MKEITLELTNRCYNNCLHCSSKAGIFESDYLEIDKVMQIVKKYNPEWVNLSGGEPLLYPKLRELIGWLKQEGYKIKIYTSGNVPECMELLDELKYYSIDKVIFSFHSCHSKLFDFIAQQKSFNYTRHSMLNALLMGHDIEAHIVPMSITMQTLGDTVDYLVRNGIPKISILKLVNQGRCTENKFLLPCDYGEVYRIKEKYGDLVRLGSPFSSNLECTAGRDKLVVKSDGQIIPCECYKDGVNKCERITTNDRKTDM